METPDLLDRHGSMLLTDSLNLLFIYLDAFGRNHGPLKLHLGRVEMALL